MLNNKGFTLVELLAVVVLLAIVMGVTASIGINIYNNSKIKAEALFIEKVNKLIDTYIALEKDSFTEINSGHKVNKCDSGIDDDNCNVIYYKVYKSGSTWVKFSNIIASGAISKNDFVNPFDKTSCDVNSVIEIYKDADEVYYYRYNLDCIKNSVNKNGKWVYNNATFVS